MAEEKPFIPMDDPRRIYKIPGTKYAMCHPGLTGSWAGYKNTAEEQRVMDNFHRANWEEVKHMKAEELRAHIEAIKHSVNEKDEADRLLIEDLCRQQDELRAQREVERRVYYRQKALKEAKKKEKEERARARAIARGEIVEDGGGDAGHGGPAQGSGEEMTGIPEIGATNGGNIVTEDGTATARDHGANGGESPTTGGAGQSRAGGGEDTAPIAHGSKSPPDQTAADGFANAIDGVLYGSYPPRC